VTGPVVPDVRPVVLVGMMASGKTNVGKRVAARLGWPFADSDAEIVARTGRSVAEVFATDGEAAFRALEADVLADLVARRPASVVATGGGAVLRPDTRRLLHEQAIVIWLYATPGPLAHRIKDDGSRPLLTDDVRGTLDRLCAERDPLYREVAHHVVAVDHVKRKILTEQVLSLLALEGVDVPVGVTS
jgi:shikimate kinase